MSNKFVENWRQISSFAKEKADYCCEECHRPGYRPGQIVLNRAYVLDCHHIDRDRSNNAESNLRVLCKSCHGRSHNAKCFNSQQMTQVKQLVLGY